MALIEHLEREDWEEFLRGTFEYALELLKTDRFRLAGSAVDDLKSWLAVGGISRVKHHLNNQMEIRNFPATKRVMVNDLLDQLVHEHRLKIVDLMAHEIIPTGPQEFFVTLGFPELEIEELLRQFAEGKSFEEVARSYGYPDDEIADARPALRASALRPSRQAKQEVIHHGHEAVGGRGGTPKTSPHRRALDRRFFDGDAQGLQTLAAVPVVPVGQVRIRQLDDGAGGDVLSPIALDLPVGFAVVVASPDLDLEDDDLLAAIAA